MAFTGFNDLVQRIQGVGRRQVIPYQKNSIASSANNNRFPTSWWGGGGTPIAGVAPAAIPLGSIPNRLTTGAVDFEHPILGTPGSVPGLTAYATTVLADTPALYWRLGEASGTVAEDATANNRDGTYGTGVTLAQGGALVSDSNTGVSLNNTTNGNITSSYDPFTGARTFEGWALRDSGTVDVIIGSTGSGNDEAILDVQVNNDVRWFPAGAGVGSIATWAGAWPIVGAYVHWVVTFDEPTDTAELFINGVSRGTQLATRAYATPGNFRIGHSTATTETFGGRVDEVAVYEHILTPARIRAHYEAGQKARFDDIYLAGSGFNYGSIFMGPIVVYERLWHGLLSTTVTTPQSITGAPNRYQGTDAVGTFAFIEIGTSLAATAHNWTDLTYVNQDGVTGRVAPTVTGLSGGSNAGWVASGVANRWFIPLADGDTGIRKFTSITLDTALASGTAHLVLGKPIGIFYGSWNPVVVDGLASELRLSKIDPDAALAFMGISNQGGNVFYTGALELLSG